MLMVGGILEASRMSEMGGMCENAIFLAGKIDMVTPGLAQARIASIKPPTPRMLITLFML